MQFKESRGRSRNSNGEMSMCHSHDDDYNVVPNEPHRISVLINYCVRFIDRKCHMVYRKTNLDHTNDLNPNLFPTGQLILNTV